MQEDPRDAILSSLSALSRAFFLILSLSLIVAFIAYGVVKKIPGTYEVHFSYMVSIEQHDVALGFRYDGYYALSSTDLFSATLASIASAPETIIAAYIASGIQPPTQDAIRLVRVVTAKKTAPALVQITVTDASQKNAEQLTSGLMTVLAKTIDEYNTKGPASLIFHGVSTTPWTSVHAPLPLPIAASMFMLVFLGGNMIVLVRQALKRGHH
ncbi:MAG TPA: hypothetical protein VJI96_00295 [Candidatus Andersenbacteria bacterium]|nr:hypothetical protein [Candidatus Andersenbacteria bacterium]